MKNTKWQIIFQKDAEKAFLKLDPSIQRKILKFFKERSLANDNPRIFGKKLKGDLGEFWRYRVEDYRIICKIEDQELLVLVLRIAHRKNVYDD